MLKKTLITATALSAFVPGYAFAVDPVPTPLTNITVEQSLIDTVTRNLPERRATGAEFLNPAYDPTIRFTENAQTAVTFISEGAGYRNSLGYFSFSDDAFDGVSFGGIDTNQSGRLSVSEVMALDGVTDAGIIFGNASGAGGFAGSGGTLRTGDTFVLGGGTISGEGEAALSMTGGSVFEADTNLGFFLMANAWDGNRVRGWDTNDDISTYWTMDFLNPENTASATVNSASDVSRHVAMLNVEGEGQVILGFEDLLRPYGDNDFNDAVFIVQTSPEGSFETATLPSVSPAPGPGIGLTGLAVALFAVGGVLGRRKLVQ